MEKNKRGHITSIRSSSIASMTIAVSMSSSRSRSNSSQPNIFITKNCSVLEVLEHLQLLVSLTDIIIIAPYHRAIDLNL